MKRKPLMKINGTRMKPVLYILLIYNTLFISEIFPLSAQTPEEIYRKPLKEVLDQVEQRFSVKLTYDIRIVQDKTVTYAPWRMKNDPEATLHAVLGPFDMVFSRNSSGGYDIAEFQYHRRTAEEGKAHLERLLSFYSTPETLEKRREELKACIWETLGLNAFPERNSLNPIVTPKRKYKGYTTENVALETLPGVFLTGTLYRPLSGKGAINRLVRRKEGFPAVLLAQGHGEIQHYGESSQVLAATLARMGALVFSYDMFAKGESGLQFAFEDHRTGMAQTMQTWNSMRVVDFLLSLPETDASRIAMTGASGGGTQTFLATLLDERIAVSVPTVMVSSWFFGGCPCESGMPVHSCGAWGTNNTEIAALAAPRPLLLISDGGDWTSTTPEIEFPFVQKVYLLTGHPGRAENAHFSTEGHDYGPSKRNAAIRFLAKHLGLSTDSVLDASGKIDETACAVESRESMLVFGEKGEKLPAHAIRGMEALKKLLSP